MAGYFHMWNKEPLFFLRNGTNNQDLYRKQCLDE